jgi:hypothetical protein
LFIPKSRREGHKVYARTVSAINSGVKNVSIALMIRQSLK